MLDQSNSKANLMGNALWAFNKDPFHFSRIELIKTVVFPSLFISINGLIYSTQEERLTFR